MGHGDRQAVRDGTRGSTGGQRWDTGIDRRSEVGTRRKGRQTGLMGAHVWLIQFVNTIFRMPNVLVYYDLVLELFKNVLTTDPY